MKIRPVGVELFNWDRQTDRHDDANSCFTQFYEHAKKTDFTSPVHYIRINSATFTFCVHEMGGACST